MNNFGKNLFAAAVLALGLAVAVPVDAQLGGPMGDRGPINESFSGNYKDPQQKAADHLAKGLRYREKAIKETDSKKKAKLLEKARSEFRSSTALHPNHDALVALGMLAIEEGNRKAAMDSCWQALGLKRESPSASTCYEQAKALPATTAAAAAGSSGN
ncbi:MAG TPA: hypothetical protein VN493_22075 [Thermoanaerobaculia bacterium]|nr:hypothetical protein [Thermoanaerobaculia bacterium]